MSKQISIKDSALFAVNGVVSHPWYFVKMFIYWLAFASLLAAGLIVMLVALGFALNPLEIHTIEEVKNVTINGTGFTIWLFIFFASFIYFLVSIYFVPLKLLLSFNPRYVPVFTFGSFFTALDLKTVFRLFSAVFIFGIIVAVGLICFIVPGIYCAVKFQWVFYYIINDRNGVMESLEKSYARTTGHFWQLLGIDIISAIIMGTFLLIPVGYLMRIRAFSKVN